MKDNIKDKEMTEKNIVKANTVLTEKVLEKNIFPDPTIRNVQNSKPTQEGNKIIFESLAIWEKTLDLPALNDKMKRQQEQIDNLLLRIDQLEKGNKLVNILWSSIRTEDRQILSDAMIDIQGNTMN